MNATELADVVAHPVQYVGMSFYFDPETRERGKEIGLNAYEFYGLGRGGTLGNVDLEVVVGAFKFFHPRQLERMWTDAKAKADPGQTSADYLRAAYSFADRTFGAIDPNLLDAFAKAAHKVAAGVRGGHHQLVDGYKQFDVPVSPVHSAYLGAILMRELRGCVHIDAVQEMGLAPVEAVYLQDVNLFKMHGYVDEEVPDVTPELSAKKHEAEVLTSTLMAEYFEVLDEVERQSLADGARAMFEALSEPVAVAG